jgi:hypothetical protein
MTVTTLRITMSLSSSLREGYSAKRPMALTGVWGVLFALNAHPEKGTNENSNRTSNLPLFIPCVNHGKGEIVNLSGRVRILTARYPKNGLERGFRCMLAF